MSIKGLLILVLTGLTGIGFAKTLAVVGSTKIDSIELDDQVKLIVKNSNGRIEDNQELRSDVLQKLVAREVIFREAKKLKLDTSKPYLDAVRDTELTAKKKGIANDPSFKRDFESYKKVLLADSYVIDFFKKNKIADKTAKATYNSMVKFYQGSEEVQIGEILTKDMPTAKKAIAQLNQGASFKTVAGKYTIDSKLKANSGIYKQYVNLKDMQVAMPQYYQVVHLLKKGQYTKQPLNSENNYLVVAVIDRRIATMPSFDSTKSSLKASMMQQKLHEESQKLNIMYNVKIY